MVRRFFERREITNLEVLIDRQGERKGKFARSLKVEGLPSTLLIDADGKEVGRLLGIAEWDDGEVVAYLRRCLVAGG